MPVTAELLKAINREVQGIPIEEERWKELAVEVNQLRQAAESALGVHDFDRDPAEFSSSASLTKGLNSNGTAKMQKMSDELHNLSLCEVADLIKTKQVSAVETLQACFERIDMLDPVHHAFVWQDRDSAMARALWLDRIQSAGEVLGSLHGVPMAHKDMYYRTGRVSACGSRIRSNEPARGTATVLRKLDAAGGIDVGGLAMVEFAMGPHGFNAHLPRSLNPWGHDRVPCGSSSGSGVAVASRMVYASLGSDTGGSVRCPAAANGIVGLLPTNELVSRRGTMPMSWSLDCVGPLTRTVRDAARILTEIAGPDANGGSRFDQLRT